MPVHRNTPCKPSAVAVLWATVLWAAVSTSADETQEAEQAIIAGKGLLTKAVNTADLATLREARALFAKGTEVSAVAPAAHYHIAYADSCAFDMGAGKTPEERTRLLDGAIEHLESVVKLDARNAEAYALLASCYGRKIGLNPAEGMILGPQAGELMTKALRHGPHNPRVLLLEAINTYHTPPMWGGSKEVALEQLKKAAECFRTWKPKVKVEPDWGHADSYVWLGIVFLDFKKTEEAQEALAEALSIDPDHGFAKSVLRPRLEGVTSKKTGE